jgi:hypothetical protein
LASVFAGTRGHSARRTAVDRLLRYAQNAIDSRPELVEVPLTVLSFYDRVMHGEKMDGTKKNQED